MTAPETTLKATHSAAPHFTVGDGPWPPPPIPPRDPD